METIGVYKIQNIRTRKMYIGSSIDVAKRFDRHIRELNKGIHHCSPLQESWNEDGKDLFLFQLIHQCFSQEEARNFEQKMLDELGDKLYNISRYAICGDLISYHPNRNEIVKKMTNSINLRYESMTEDERRAIYGSRTNGMTGKTHTEEVKQKMSETHKGNTYAKGHKRTPEQRKRLSEIASKRIGDKNPFYGKSHSEETKKKLSSKMKGTIPTNAKPVIINNTIYNSASEAGRQLGIAPATVINRIKSNKFPTYKYLET